MITDTIASWNIQTHMDFEGQKKAERTFQVIIILFAAVGFVWGYICQQFSQTVYILGAGFVLSCLLTLPPWPMYRLKPLNWQKPVEIPDETKGAGDGKHSNKNKKKNK